MLSKRKVFAMALGFVLVGCGDNNKSVVAPQLRPNAGGVTADKAKGNESDDSQDIDVSKAVEWVHGSLVFMAAPDTRERIANSARKNADGTVDGRFVAKDPAHRITGSIVCFAVAANTVR